VAKAAHGSIVRAAIESVFDRRVEEAPACARDHLLLIGLGREAEVWLEGVEALWERTLASSSEIVGR